MMRRILIGTCLFLLASTGFAPPSQGASGPELDGIWKLASARHTQIDFSSFPPVPKVTTVTLSPTLTDPDTGLAAEHYLEIAGGKVATYTRVGPDGGEGAAYLRTTLDARCTATACSVALPGSSAQTTYMLSRGALTTTWVDAGKRGPQNQPTSMTIIELSYERDRGAFPPPTWPTRMVDPNALLTEVLK